MPRDVAKRRHLLRDDGAEIDRQRRAQSLMRPGRHQHPIQQIDAAIDNRQQVVHRFPQRRTRPDTPRHDLGPRLERRQGCAQLMRHIVGEFPFPLQAITHARKQIIQRRIDRQNFFGYPLHINGRKIVRIALVDSARQGGQWRKGPADAEGDDYQQGRDQA